MPCTASRQWKFPRAVLVLVHEVVRYIRSYARIVYCLQMKDSDKHCIAAAPRGDSKTHVIVTSFLSLSLPLAQQAYFIPVPSITAALLVRVHHSRKLALLEMERYEGTFAPGLGSTLPLDWAWLRLVVRGRKGKCLFLENPWRHHSFDVGELSPFFAKFHLDFLGEILYCSFFAISTPIFHGTQCVGRAVRATIPRVRLGHKGGKQCVTVPQHALYSSILTAKRCVWFPLVKLSDEQKPKQILRAACGYVPTQTYEYQPPAWRPRKTWSW